MARGRPSSLPGHLHHILGRDPGGLGRAGRLRRNPGPVRRMAPPHHLPHRGHFRDTCASSQVEAFYAKAFRKLGNWATARSCPHHDLAAVSGTGRPPPGIWWPSCSRPSPAPASVSGTRPGPISPAMPPAGAICCEAICSRCLVPPAQRPPRCARSTGSRSSGEASSGCLPGLDRRADAVGQIAVDRIVDDHAEIGATIDGESGIF